MERHTALACCAWCGTTGTGATCPTCGHDLGHDRSRCTCPACQGRPVALTLVTNSMLRDRAGMIACRLRVYAATDDMSEQETARAQPVILCDRLDRADRRDGAIALGPDTILPFIVRHFAPIGRADAPTIERFLWIEGRAGRYALLSFAPNRDEAGGMAGWREAFGTLVRRIPLTVAEVVALTGDTRLAG